MDAAMGDRDMTYTPTDEQIEALAQAEVSRDFWRELSQQIRSLTIERKRREIGRPAFQAIIRAAQAEAFREWAALQEQALSGHASDETDFAWAEPWIKAARAYADRIEERGGGTYRATTTRSATPTGRGRAMREATVDEEHWCWSECCDQGPHGCICGNDCHPVLQETESSQDVAQQLSEQADEQGRTA